MTSSVGVLSLIGVKVALGCVLLAVCLTAAVMFAFLLPDDQATSSCRKA